MTSLDRPRHALRNRWQPGLRVGAGLLALVLAGRADSGRWDGWSEAAAAPVAASNVMIGLADLDNHRVVRLIEAAGFRTRQIALAPGPEPVLAIAFDVAGDRLPGVAERDRLRAAADEIGAAGRAIVTALLDAPAQAGRLAGRGFRLAQVVVRTGSSLAVTVRFQRDDR